MKLCVSKFIFPFLILLGLSRPLYAMNVEDVWGLQVVSNSIVSPELDLKFFGHQPIDIGINFSDVGKKKNFINALYEQDWTCPSVTDKIIAILPNGNIQQCNVYGNILKTGVLFAYKVPTAFGDLVIQTIPADGTDAPTHKKLQVSYSAGIAKPSSTPHAKLNDNQVKYDYTDGILTFEHKIPGLVSKIYGGGSIPSLDNRYVFYTRHISMYQGNIQVMDSTGENYVDATENTFHSFTWKGMNILVRIGTIEDYCITITPCSSLPVDPLRVIPKLDSVDPPLKPPVDPP